MLPINFSLLDGYLGALWKYLRECYWQTAFININERLKGKMFYLLWTLMEAVIQQIKSRNWGSFALIEVVQLQYYKWFVSSSKVLRIIGKYSV